MDRQTALQKMKDMTFHNVLMYSANYLGDKPKEDCELEWKEARELAKAVNSMFDELLADRHGHWVRKFTGVISGMDKVEDFFLIEFETDGVPNSTELFRTKEEMTEFFSSGEFERQQNGQEFIPRDYSTPVHLYVDNNSFITKLEWVNGSR